MIERIAVQNFRCFSELEVSGLKRVNLIVGRNSSGKSAFLESLFLSAGAAAPTVAFQLRAFRQLGNQIQVAADASSYEGLWRDLFHWFDQSRTIWIVATGDSGDTRSLRVAYNPSTAQMLPFGSQQVGGGFFPEIVFEWQRGSDTPRVIRPKITGKGLELEGASVEHFPITMFGPHVADPPEDNAKRFSELSKRGRITPVVDALRAEYPFVDSLSIEYNNNIPMVFASLVGRSEKLPIGLVSDGVNKLLSVLLAIANVSKGTVLIDEFENGFYYDRMESIWETVYAFARFNEVQIFATTHSQECLRSMVPVLQKNAKDFCLLRTERSDSDSMSKVVRFEGQQLLSALSKDGEIR